MRAYRLRTIRLRDPDGGAMVRAEDLRDELRGARGCIEALSPEQTNEPNARVVLLVRDVFEA